MRALCWSVADYVGKRLSSDIDRDIKCYSNSLDYFFRLPLEIYPESTAVVYIRLAVIAYFFFCICVCGLEEICSE